MRLRDSVPIERIRAEFPECHESVQATSVAEWRRQRAKDVPSTLLFVWDAMVDMGVAKDPMKVSPIVNGGFRGLFDFVERELGRPPLLEAFATEFFNDVDPGASFVELSLVRCFPHDLHLSDVEFSDNRRRAPADQERKFKGLHVFGDFLDNLKQVARHSGDDRISLVAASRAAHDVFLRHGFQVNPTQVSLMGFRRSGMGHSMFLPVR